MILFFLAVVAMLELARALPLIPAFRALAACGQHAMRLLARRGVSDWGKERALRILSGRMFVRAMRAGGLLFATAAPVLVVLALDANWPEIAAFRSDWMARLALMPFTLGYAVLRWQVIPRVQRG
ncbi:MULTISPECIES: hypothetical protein [Sphingomonas]|uniref:Uncharacterized protein n=1 Tax=Sphingomonas leidyi TaxID=68569 RepID=A0A7X5UW16_9SPHN|nr:MULTISPECIES: hypothetical protein [Sphingomonas]MBN8812102.1 hypothetical protein [Sphingomonas sp.]NIJ63246.1 hypothetical protein [Sphingomonas leidyi]OJY48260.1 MAG: hypothetical protein BGP17_00275 [Sphingomonas sp. 67-41]